MFVTNTSAKTASMITPEKLPGSTEADGSSKGMANVSYFETLHNGKLGSTPMQWNDPSTGKKMTLHVAGSGRLTEDDKPLGMTTFRNVASTKTGTLLDVGKATFGDKVIGAKGFDNIIVSDQTAAKVYMPANNDGTANFARLKQFNAVQAEIEKHKGE